MIVCGQTPWLLGQDAATDAANTAHMSFLGVHYTRVARDRAAGAAGDTQPSLDPGESTAALFVRREKPFSGWRLSAAVRVGTVALALALASAEARPHLSNAVACAGGDERFFYAKH